ncbi:MAG: TfoX/Sxy family protein [Rubrivivax sp.]|nr:TfoX/Sxy family protein [Rubrivivax sp.]
MAADDFPAYCEELLAPTGRVQRRRMFGGHGLYVDGLFVAIIAFERLYLKADAASAPRFEAAGAERFVYSARGRTVQLNYWTAPAEAMESPAAMLPWVRLAQQAALSAKAVQAAPKVAPAARKPKNPRPR